MTAAAVEPTEKAEIPFNKQPRDWRKAGVIVAFSAIPVALLVIFTYWPFGSMIGYSFYKMKYIGPRQFVGLQNYIDVFTRPDTLSSLKLSLYYMVGALIQVALALYLSTMLAFKVRGGSAFKAIYFFPYLINGIAVGFIFKFFYTRGYVFDTVLQWCGFQLDNLPYWLKDQSVNNWSLVGASVWRYLGQNVILFIGAMMSIDSTLYGADAVYLAGTSFGMRSFAGNFSDEELPRAVDFAHRHGVKVHATVNTMPRSGEVDRLPEHLEKLNDAGVDALILADLGAFILAGKYAPRCQRHISTQQSIANYACAQAWFDLGAQRVVLARELGMDEIREIRRRVDPALELETFCHGAMCVSYSGRCLLSNYMTGRDSNRGACAQPCRYQYALMEEKRPGEYFPVFEDEKGTYIMNSRDMCMIDHLDDLMDAGVDCLKIEGRAKSAYYAAIVTGAYRHVLDDVAAGRPVDPVWRDEVEHVSHRHYSTGFFYGQPGQFYEDARYIRDWQICAVVTDCTPEGLATLSLRNKFACGDQVEVVGPDTKPFTMTAPMMTDSQGLPLTEPKTPQMVFTMQLPRPVPPMSFIRHAVDLGGR